MLVSGNIVHPFRRFARRTTNTACDAADGWFEAFVEDLADWVADG